MQGVVAQPVNHDDSADVDVPPQENFLQQNLKASRVLIKATDTLGTQPELTIDRSQVTIKFCGWANDTHGRSA